MRSSPSWPPRDVVAADDVVVVVAAVDHVAALAADDDVLAVLAVDRCRRRRGRSFCVSIDVKVNESIERRQRQIVARSRRRSAAITPCRGRRTRGRCPRRRGSVAAGAAEDEVVAGAAAECGRRRRRVGSLVTMRSMSEAFASSPACPAGAPDLLIAHRGRPIDEAVVADDDVVGVVRGGNSANIGLTRVRDDGVVGRSRRE